MAQRLNCCARAMVLECVRLWLQLVAMSIFGVTLMCSSQCCPLNFILPLRVVRIPPLALCFCTSIISPPFVCLVTLLLYFIFCPYVSLIVSLFPRRIFMYQHAYQVTGGAQKKLSSISKVRKNVRLPQFLHCTRPPSHKFISIPSSHSTDRPCVDHPQREGSLCCPRRILQQEVRPPPPPSRHAALFKPSFFWRLIKAINRISHRPLILFAI